MLFRIYHREDVVYASRTMSKCLIPWILEKSRADAVNFIEHLRVANVDFIWSNSYDWAVLLVECINVEDPSSEDDVLLENQMCKTGIPWTRNLSQRRSETSIEELFGLNARSDSLNGVYIL